MSKNNRPVAAVHVVSDRTLSRQRLTEILCADPGLFVAARPQELTPKLPCRLIVFVIDAASLQPTRKVAVRDLIERHRGAKLVLVGDSASPSGHGLVAPWLLGVHGAVALEEVDSCLVPAVRAVVSGLVCSSGKFLSHPPGLEATTAVDRLTPAERSVLALLEERFTNKEAAKMLRIKVATVKFHTANILAKLAIHSRHDLPRPWHASDEKG